MAARTVVGVFRHEDDLVGATRAVRRQGFAIEDVYAPYAVHAFDDAMGLVPSRLPRVCFGLGLTGAALMLLFQFWTSSVSWAINVGGRPWNSLPAFVPVTFEVMVLFAGVGTVLAFLGVSRLRPWRQAVMPVAGVTDDLFALVVALDEGQNQEAVAAILTQFRPVSIEDRVALPSGVSDDADRRGDVR